MHKSFELVFVSILTFNAIVNGYYVQHDEFEENSNQEIITDYHIESSNSDTEFPDKFFLKFSTLGVDHKIKFKRNENLNHEANIYTVKDGQLVQHQIREKRIVKTYDEVNGLSVVTLIKNNDLSETVHREQPFRILGRIHESNKQEHYDITPVLVKRSLRFEKRKRSVDEISKKYTQEQYHSVHKRNGSHHNYGKDYQIINKAEETHHKQKRANSNGQPTNLYVEMLVVTDQSVYAAQQRFSNSNNQELVFLHMRVYFAQLMYICNSRYSNSLKTDPDMRLNIQVIAFLFLTSSASWTDPNIVGDPSNPTYNGRQVIVTTKTLNQFSIFMNNTFIPFPYDHAMGFFDKDLWADTPDSPATRSAAVGYSYILGVCSPNYKFSISEEIGGLYYANVAAHELGHCLGSQHDGLSPYAVNCPAGLNYIMTPGALVQTSFFANQVLFSSCSISQFKQGLLSSTLSSASSAAQCLINIPTLIPVETKSSSLSQPGSIWTADDQCKMIYGVTNGSFCHTYGGNGICTALYCRPSNSNYNCYQYGIGAVDGTPCGSGQSCSQGQCIADPKVPNSNCLYGDDLVASNDILNLYTLPSPYVTCSAAISYLNSINVDFVFFCATQQQFTFSTACCDTCSKYKSITCIDQSPQCSQYAQSCSIPGIVVNGIAIGVFCPYTCGTCTRPVYTCATSSSWCLNGALCSNIAGALPKSQIIGFTCTCKAGYSGQFCQIVNPCLVNGGPCLNGQTCQRIGSFGYSCFGFVTSPPGTLSSSNSLKSAFILEIILLGTLGCFVY